MAGIYTVITGYLPGIYGVYTRYLPGIYLVAMTYRNPSCIGVTKHSDCPNVICNW